MRSWLRLSLFAGVVLASLVPTSAHAEPQSPVSLSLFPPVQIVPPKGSVYGFRLNLVGQNQTMHGLDIGIVNLVDKDFIGFQWLGFGWVEGNTQGVQWNYIANITRGTMEGAQFGIFNLASERAAGVQWGLVSWSETDLTGLQVGAVDYSPQFTGLQFGLVNVTEDLNGFQIGLVNVAKNGFLPVFPIVNFHLD